MKFVLGIDEAGRGPLAGPVSVGLVKVSHGFDVAKEFPSVADSKAISEKKREALYEHLCARRDKGDVRFTVAYGEAAYIDTFGIVPAIRDAIARGLMTLSASPDDVHILLDGSLAAPAPYTQETIIKGDATVPIISLASIAAKVSRDRLMVEMAKQYPMYGFEKHKGYGTKYHYEMIAHCGPSAIHRHTFLPH